MFDHVRKSYETASRKVVQRACMHAYPRGAKKPPPAADRVRVFQDERQRLAAGNVVEETRVEELSLVLDIERTCLRLRHAKSLWWQSA